MTHAESTRATALRLAGAVAMLVVGGVHAQQYVSTLSDVPTIGTLFLINGAASAAVVVALLLPERPVRLLAAAGGVAISVGSLVAIFLAQGGGVFGYEETSYRTAVVVSIVSEVLGALLLGAYLLETVMRRGDRAGEERALSPGR